MTTFKNIEQFEITHDRHKELYGYKFSNFADKHSFSDSALNYTHDPDWTRKMENSRVNLKRFFLCLTAIALWYECKKQSVMRFDHLKRVEQRAMQNKEIDEFKDKKVYWTLFEPDSKEYVPAPNSYQIIWFDAKMKNYENLITFLTKKRVLRTAVHPVLLVDKETHMKGVLEVWARIP